MLTDMEEQFLVYWQLNREKEQKSFKDYLKGLSSGLGIGAAILLAIITGWYKRANMEVNSKLSGSILVIALAGIAIFMAWLYKNYQWEMKEQHYLELLAKKKRKNKSN